jgi:replicative DNA helicase
MVQYATLKKPLVESGESAVSYRVLPHNQDAEQALLGALLVDNRAYEKVGDFLKSNQFFLPAHQRIFEAIIKMIDRGQTASPVTLKNYFEKDDDLKDVGGAEYLADLAASVVSVINAQDYARTIYDLHLKARADFHRRGSGE